MLANLIQSPRSHVSARFAPLLLVSVRYLTLIGLTKCFLPYRQGKDWRSLKHGNMRCHLAGFLYDLYTASTGTDNPHPLAAKLNPLLGPVARMVALPVELPDALKIGCLF